MIPVKPPIVFSACVILVGLGCALPEASRAETPSPPPTTNVWLGDAGIDAAKARAHRLEQKTARLRWEQRTTLDDYERTGKKDPRWDADVRATFEEFAHALAQEPDSAARIAAAKAPCQRALTAGCKDPLLAYFALRLGLSPAGTTPVALAQLYAQVEQELEKSAYSPLRKLYASYRAAEQASKSAGPKTAAGQPPPSPPGTDIAGSLTRARTHLVELLRDAGTQRESIYVAADDFLHFAEHDIEGQSCVFAPLETVFASGELNDAGKTATARLVEGVFWTTYAWQGRTSQWAKDVSGEGWKHFAERLPKAEAALQKAYDLDPADPGICRAMMTVELGQGQGRERMETWFRRAMDADPDYYDACAAMLLYLEPKWYGNAEAMLDFGHRCQSTANWRARLPFILLFAHTKLASYEAVPLAYWRKPEVWTDVQALYKAALAADPGSTFERSGYLLYAYRAEQWKLADELFKALGDKPNLQAMDCTPEKYEAMRRRTAAQLQKK